MRIRRLVCGLGLVVGMMAGAARGQVDVSAWPRVQVEVFAFDGQGIPLDGLTADALVVRDGKKAHAIVDLKPAMEPQTLCLLVDASDAMRDRLAVVLTKARRLVRKLPAGDELCVAHYGGGLVMDQKLTEDRDAVVRNLLPIRPSGAAGLRDALLDLSEYMRQASGHRSRAIILLSDVADEGSAAGKDELRQGLQLEGSPVVHLLCIPPAFGRALWKQDGEDVRGALGLTKAGGGLTFFPHTIAEFDSIVDSIPALMASRYLLTYEASNVARDGQERRMEFSFGKEYSAKSAYVLAPEEFEAPSE